MRSVLLVDDQALFRKALASLLSDAGWEVEKIPMEDEREE